MSIVADLITFDYIVPVKSYWSTDELRSGMPCQLWHHPGTLPCHANYASPIYDGLKSACITVT